MADVRGAVRAFPKLIALGGSTVLILSASYGTAFAYLDPGTGSIILQSVIAAIIGSMAFGRMYWTRLKDVLRRTLNSGQREHDPKNK